MLDMVEKIQALMVSEQKRKPEQAKPSAENSGVFYRVQVGAFKKQHNADELKEELQQKGYPAMKGK